MKARPDSNVVTAGDLNHATLNTVMPKFLKNVNIPTRAKNTLDQVYTNIQKAYKVIPLPHLGLSDHLALSLIPAYRPLISREKPTTKTVYGMKKQLQLCRTVLR